MSSMFNPDGSIKNPGKKLFFTAVGYLASEKRKTKLDVELPVVKRFEFENRYAEITGITPTPDKNNYFLLHDHADKWSVEMRVYFLADNAVPSYLQPLIVSARPGTIHNARINDNDIIWKLIKNGFRLGDEQDMNLISSTIPTMYQPDYEKGLKL